MSVASKGFPEASPAEMTSRAALFTAASLVSMLTSGLSLFVERSSATTTRHSVSTWAGVLRVRLVFMVLFSSIVAGQGNAQDRGIVSETTPRTRLFCLQTFYILQTHG